jgi:hypothetical protein
VLIVDAMKLSFIAKLVLPQYGLKFYGFTVKLHHQKISLNVFK